MDVEETVGAEPTAVGGRNSGRESWEMAVTDRPSGEICETRQSKTFEQDQSDSTPVPEAGPGDAVTMGNRSDSDISKGVELERDSLSDRLERGICQSRSNIVNSVTMSVQGSSKTTSDCFAICSGAEAKKEEGGGDSQKVTTTTTHGLETAENPGKVIVTNVTINSVTVTFKEAMVAEGFFKGC